MEHGFSLVGFTEAKLPEIDQNNILTWISEGRHGSMDWFAKETASEIRSSFQHLGFVPKTAITLAFVYRSEASEKLVTEMQKKVSRYALGDDYHDVLRKKGKQIIQKLKQKYPSYAFRQSVDSLPIAEKVLAVESGIGWRGKNTNTINRDLGSYFFISVILTELEFSFPKLTKTDHCGTCRLCIDSCPTGALEPYKIDARKCISYQTIEDRQPNVLENKDKHNWVYGCDICQEVCPWNEKVAKRNQVETTEPTFFPKDFWTDPDFLSHSTLSAQDFDSYFKGSAIERIGVGVWNRNWG